ncbi:HAD family hydrolase [Streptomyces microflavus]|uniref:HAD family phosphatase n=3 Tax=Streptomyces microflavus TaxID=1919 RepID=A0ABV1Q8G4_STRMI|nr:MULTISPECIES: HAD family phosphatase [Streptomyces]QTA31845.1 HAD family phosphatase [Streptomyces sp. CA-256286]SCK19226.1 haloacid dehalogenase superfamily, subfamily IA, variant 3 with third motif having DD or ED [Streptomyces sp. ScaeMP-e48]AGK76996.1 Hydrolase [Streptomyces microflavus DSM 40593]MEE1728399.1 HAD family phosphatase [Streptomyces sp. BE282]GGX45371.1 hydrolase [Streptomyces microflavus]
MRTSAPAAVLFDMDGTLVDTEVLWWETAREVAAGLGHRLTDADAPEVVGRAVADTAAHLIGVTGGDASALPSTADDRAAALARTAAELTDSFFRKVDAGAPLRPGAAALLASLEGAGVPFALVSASPRSVVDAVVAGSLAGVDFAFTLSADDTVRTKPHPDPYRTAAERFAADPAACVAVEDSPDGTASADAAGCAVLVVPSLLPVAPGRGRTFARSLEEVDLGVLSDCLRRP